MKRKTTIEMPSLENSDGTTESVFGGFHISDKYLKIYVEGALKLKPEQKRSIEQHIIDICPNSECQDRIDKLVKKMHDNDPKMSQLPEGDR